MNSISQPFSHAMPECVGAAFDMAVSEAWRFAGQTAPNPAVGCVLLDAQGTVLVMAAHHRAGELHAERLAVEQARALGVVERIHTAVVTLEPCNHTGRTPPCTQALLSTPVQVVWIGCADPNPHVPGGGAAYLQARGLDVRWLAHAANGAACMARCRALLAPFAWRMVHGRPWITVKQAVNAQGGMAPPPGHKTFTTAQSLHFAHALRRVTDGLVTGTGTVRADLPSFTVRHVPDHPARRRVLVVCGARQNTPAQWLEQAEQRFDVLFCPDCTDLPALLATTQALWVMVEAGPTLLRALREQALWDDWLTIGQDAHGCDHFSVSTRHGISPLSLFPQWAQCTQEQACFPVL